VENTNNEIWAVAIIRGDNDFYSTFTNLLHSVNNLIKYYEGSFTLEEMKYRVLIAIVSGVSWHYQNFQHDGIIPEQDTIAYLTNDKLRVLFNEEAFHEWEHVDYDSGAWFLDCRTGKISSF